MTLAAPAAVLWDMDGTIVDTEPYWIECEHLLVAEHGNGQWDDTKAHLLVGKDLRDSARLIQEHGGVTMAVDDIVNYLLDGVIERVRRAVPWRPGARDLLAKLRHAGVPQAMVTMSWARFADAVVQALPKGTFAAVITGDQVRRGKPHPEPYLAAADALGVKAKDCVAIEDSPTGLRSAVAAGCRTFAVPNVVEVPESRSYTRVRSLREIDLPQLGVAVGPASKKRRLGGDARTAVAATIGALLTAAVFAGAVWLFRDDTPPPLEDIPMAGWMPYWEADRAAATVGAQGGLFHELSPFWFEARGATDVGYAPGVDGEMVAGALAAAQQSGALVIPSIADVMGAGGMAGVLADPGTRTAHVQALLGLARGGSFDGIDIDYEKFAFADDRSTWAATRTNWMAFLRELADGLHSDGRILTVAVPPIYDDGSPTDPGAWVYDYAGMGEVVDRIRIMAYDYSFADPGPIAPVEFVRTVVRAAKRVVADDNKLVLGIPLYGRNWVTATSGTCPADAPGTVSPTLPEIGALLQEYGATSVYDATTGEKSFTYERPTSDGVTSCTQTRQVNFVDGEGALARVTIAREEHIGGVSFWAIGFDNPGVWQLVGPYARAREA